MPFRGLRDTGKSVKIKKSCQNCEKLKKDKEDLENTLKKARERIYSLGKMNSFLKQENEKLRQSSDYITAAMANLLENKGDLENINDEFANKKLAKRFQNLYENNWTELADWLDENNPTLSQLEKIKTLTAFSKQAYEECVRIAEDQIRQFLVLPANKKIPSFHDEPELFKIRRQSGQQQHARDELTKRVLSELFTSDNTQALYQDENKETTMKKLQDFFREFIDCCWLMTISNPRLFLNFEVVGKLYSGRIKERFKQFSCDKTVVSENNYVLEVVWPSVELADCFLAKGDVVTVDTGKGNLPI